MIRFACPYCSEKFRLDDSKAGQRWECDRCGHEFFAPAFVPRPASRVRLKWVVLSILAACLLGGVVLARPRVTVSLPEGLPVLGRIVQAPAAQPEPKAKPRLEPAQQAVLDYLTKFSPDPSAVEVIEWWPPVPANSAMSATQYDQAVYFVMRGRNRLGALAVSAGIAYLDKGQVAAISSRSDYADPMQWNMEIGRLYKIPQKAPLNDMLHEMVKDGPQPRDH